MYATRRFPLKHCKDIGLILLGIGLLLGFLAQPTAPIRSLSAAPQQPSSTPHLVGRTVCRECHQENFSLHEKHGHASTFHSVASTNLAAKFADRSFDAGQTYGTYHYQSDSNGNLSVTLPAQFGEERFPLQYALGSGHNAQTMLTLAPGADGQTEGIEHRVSCYAEGRLAITPGHSEKFPGSALQFFGDASRGIPLQRCIYCHTTSARLEQLEIVDLVANVNCEKCHGPGSDHVRAARASPTPPPYSVGRSTWDAESELQLCGDCHRLPKSVSEKEIREYPKLLARFQPIGMLRSECYLESEGQLRCSSCHNPHRSIHQQSESEHVQHCVACHDSNTSKHTVCPVSPSTGCIECHMPVVETEQGLRFHDHWIRIQSK